MPTADGRSVDTAPRQARATRTLNQIPASILEDASLNAAIAHLPSNYTFELHKTIHRIRTLSARNVALQFPEGLLLFAPLISDIVTTFCPGTQTLIMGDVTYGACCIDDYTARALGCDLLVHYGHSCLVPMSTTAGIATLYVFVTIGIDVAHLLATVERNFQPGRRIALVGTIQFNATLHAIVPRLRQLGFDPVLPRSSPLSAGEILGCTAPTLTKSAPALDALRDKPPSSREAGYADMVLYVGDGRFHLEAILIASPQLRAHTYRYDPYARRLTHETYAHAEMHSLRSHAIATARASLQYLPSQFRDGSHVAPDAHAHAHARAHSHAHAPSPPLAAPRTWGLILGTLGRQGNPHTVTLIRSHLLRHGVPCITLLLSEISPDKLARMSDDVAVWVQVACPRLSIDWGYAFERPLLSPYEALVALEVREGGWEMSSGKKAHDEASLAPGTKGTGTETDTDDVATYPMDFYERNGLGRTTETDLLPTLMAGLEVEVR